jgi:hypothetical protein
VSPTFCRYVKEVRQTTAKAPMRGRSSDYQLIRSKCHEKFAARQFQESMIDDTPPQRLKNIRIQESTARWSSEKPAHREQRYIGYFEVETRGTQHGTHRVWVNNIGHMLSGSTLFYLHPSNGVKFCGCYYSED